MTLATRSALVPAIEALLAGTGARIGVPGGNSDDLARRLAMCQRRLRGEVGAGEVVGVRAERAPAQAAGFLAVAAEGGVPALFPPRAAAVPPGIRTFDVGDEQVALAPRAAEPLVAPPDTVYVQLSGGTTGSATGVTIGAAALDAQLTMMRKELPDDAVAVGWLPLHHDMGLISQLLGPVVHGVRSVLLEPGQWLRDPMRLLTAVAQYGGTNTWMPSFGFAHCLRRIPADTEPVDLSSLRLLGCGGEPIDVDVVAAFLERFEPWGLDPAALMTGYGMAEAVCGVTLSRGGAPRTEEVVPPVAVGVPVLPAPTGTGRRVATCGGAVGALEVAVRREGRTLPDRYAGEVCLRGAGLASHRLTGRSIEPLTGTDGWLHTGDLGYTDAGELFVLDRLDDCLVLAGRNVQPSHIERVADRAAAPDGRRVAAFGVRDGNGRQRLVIVLEHRGAGDEAVRRAVARRVRHAVLHRCGVLPVHVHVTSDRAVMFGSSGKTSRAATRDRYLAEHGDAAPGLSVEDVLDLLAAVSGHEEVDPGDRLADADLDSLALVEVLAVLEAAIGTELDLAGLPRDASVADLLPLLIPRQERRPAVIDLRPPGPGVLRHLTDVQRGPVLHGRALPYPAGRTLLAAIARDSRLRRSLAGDGLELVRRCLADVPDPPPLEEVLRQSVEVNLWTAWYREALRPDAVRRRWVRVQGLERLQRPAARGLLLLAPHSPLTFLLELEPGLAGSLVIRTRDTGPARRAALYREARDVLRRGGQVVLLPDEFAGSGGLPVTVGGRRRLLRWGFGRLLEDTGAVGVPWFPAVGPGWALTSRFEAPLSGVTPDELLAEYADLLDAFWRSSLGLLEWHMLRRHLALSEPVAAV